MMKMGLRRKNQAGVALITVLLVFALVAVIAGEVMFRHYRDMRKTANLINSKQAYHFALSGEQYARQILYRDFREGVESGRKADRLDDDWALNFKPFDIEGGEMTIEIIDLQGRFNLNNLINRNGAADGIGLDQYRKLQRVLAIKTDYSDALVDWLDNDQLSGADGGEDDAYEQYLPANRPMVDKTELRLLREMSEADYQQLQPLVTALPKQIQQQRFDGTKYNINTVDAKLLEAFTGLSASDAQAITNRQQQGGFDTLNEWLAAPQGAGLNPISGQLTTSTEFFAVVVKASYQQRICVLTTQLHRNPNNGTITVIHRQMGEG